MERKIKRYSTKNFKNYNSYLVYREKMELINHFEAYGNQGVENLRFKCVRKYVDNHNCTLEDVQKLCSEHLNKVNTRRVRDLEKQNLYLSSCELAIGWVKTFNLMTKNNARVIAEGNADALIDADFCTSWRFTSNGGVLLMAPGESANNYYCNNKNLIKIMQRHQ